ncbi:MAG: aminotransferase class V-fold PLP-dependent enzyme, partial [Pseudomonadota bacterium]|nr:aminotransferase class V-fold PLP-dependent enzyme [Pseudomonadota bacterium]
MASSPYKAGKHFLQIPGPSNVPDRILRAMDYPTIDHRGPDFAKIGAACLAGMKTIFKTDSHVVIYPASGTGAWEAALVNLLAEGDLVLMVETGHFATLWHKMASNLGLETEFLSTDWRRGVDPQAVEDRLRADTDGKIKAVCVVHNETSTGSTSRIDEVRTAMNAAGHDALLMVDTISSLASIDYRHDEWGVDVTVSGSQKGLMLPPGLSFNALSERAIEESKTGGMRRSYWDWQDQIAANASGAFPFTPATNL